LTSIARGSFDRVPATKTQTEVQRPFLEYVAAFFFVLTFVIKAFVDDAYAAGDVSATVAYTKYATAAIACLAAFACVSKRGERVFVREFDELLVIFITFSVVSMILMLTTGVMSTVVFFELFKFVMPIILAYSMLNAIDNKTFYRCMVIILMVSVAGYLYTLGKDNVSISDFLNADFSTSDSATESSSFSGISLVLTFYFAFFRKRKVWLVLATAFCILTFKRMALVFALVALIISIFAPQFMSRRVPKRVVNALKLLTIAFVALWAWMLLPDQEGLFIRIFNDTPRMFTMGRSETFRYLLSSGFQSYGFGSANETINSVFGMPFEMDLIKIAFELTPLVMALFVWLYWDVAGTTLWGVFIIGYFMLNMITSDSLTSNFCLTLAYITCGLVEYGTPKMLAGKKVRFSKCGGAR
jgi:hypothetical protein